jgi:hypothetical protein
MRMCSVAKDTNYKNSVSNLVIVRLVAELFSLPLEGVSGTADAYTDYELHGVLCTISNYVYRTTPIASAKAFEIREAATTFWNVLLASVKDKNGLVDRATGLFSGLWSGNHTSELHALGEELKNKLNYDEKTALLAAAQFCQTLSIAVSNAS